MKLIFGILGLVKLSNMKLTWVKGNCEKKNEIKSNFSVFFCKQKV